MANDRNIVIKKADTGSCVVIWDRNDYITEAKSQLKNEIVYKKVSFKQDMLCELVTKSNGFLKDLRRSGCIMEKELKYFSYEYKKITNLGKLYLLPKIHKKLENVPGRPVISKCGTDFLKKIKNLGSLPENAILVTADVVGLYPSIPHEAGLQALEEALENINHKQISTDSVCTKE